MKNEIVYLKCIDITNEGQGVCKKDNLVIFVKDMLIDEEAYVKIIAEKKNLSYGIIDKLIKPSKYRIEPLCNISYKCGGCDFQYIDYDYQLILKKKILESTFKNMSIDINVHDVLRSDNFYYYRNKVQIPTRNKQFGFYRKYSNDIVEFDKCYCQSELENDVFNELKRIILDLNISKYFRHILIKHAFKTNEIMIGLIVNDLNIENIDLLISKIVSKYPEIKSIILDLNNREDNVILGEKEQVIYGREYIIDEFADLKFKINLKSFYQINYSQIFNLYNLAKEISNISKDDIVLDLYCGIGTISLFFSKYVKEVTGVEIVKDAVKNAKENAKLNNINNVTFYLDDANNDMNKYLIDKDLVIVDPPRKGLNNRLIDTLLLSDVKKILYISCNPATLARDLSLLSKKYLFTDAYPVDMFPQTKHVETVVLLTLKNQK